MGPLYNRSLDDAVKIKLKRKEDELKLEYLDHMNQSLDAAQDKNNGNIPHKIVFNIVQSSVATQSWITRHEI